MPTAGQIFSHWQGTQSKPFSKIIQDTFMLPEKDGYIYRAEAFAMTLSEIQALLDTNDMKYQYFLHGAAVQIPPADIAGYTSLFSSTLSTPKAMTGFAANAKKGSPREKVSGHLLPRRLTPANTSIPRCKIHINPYYDVWKQTCEMTGFLGPLPDASYARPEAASVSHPVLPVLYHHFGCVCPSYEALWIINDLAKGRSLLDIGSGNGYWSYMLRRMGTDVVAVDDASSTYRHCWIDDTVQADGREYLRRHGGGRTKVLMMVYPVTAGKFTDAVLKAYEGDTIVIIGTMNANRFTAFPDRTAEEYFSTEKKDWDLRWRIPLPSFAGKDDGMLVWRRN